MLPSNTNLLDRSTRQLTVRSSMIRRRRAMLALAIASCCGWVGQTFAQAPSIPRIEASQGNIKAPSRSLRLVSGSVTMNPFVVQPIGSASASGSSDVRQTAGEQQSEIRLKSIGTAVGLLPIGSPAQTATPLIVEPTSPSTIRVNPMAVTPSVHVEPIELTSPLDATSEPMSQEEEEPFEFSFSDDTMIDNAVAEPISTLQTSPVPIQAVVAPAVTLEQTPAVIDEVTEESKEVAHEAAMELAPIEEPVAVKKSVPTKRMTSPVQRVEEPLPLLPPLPMPTVRAVEDVVSALPPVANRAPKIRGRAAVSVAPAPMSVVSHSSPDRTGVSVSPASIVAVGSIQKETVPSDVPVLPEHVLTCSVTDVLSITLPGEVERVSLAIPQVCRFVGSASRHLRVLGCGDGTTRMTVQYADPESGQSLIREYQINVQPQRTDDAATLKGEDNLMRLIDQTYPSARIDFQNHGDRVVVSGSCESRSDATAILRLVRKSFLVPVEDQLVIR